MSSIRRFTPDDAGNFRWQSVDALRYKEEGSAPFKAVTRQVLFAPPDQASELRYFEVAPGGFSTLERHEHTHAVLILRGRGTVLLDGDVQEVRQNDLVSIDAMTWHQFHAAGDGSLGFLCLVSKERDRPQLPTESERGALERRWRQP